MRLDKPFEALCCEGSQQAGSIAEMVSGRRMGNACAFGAAAQREALDAFFGKLQFGRFQQRRAQIAVVIGFSGDGFLGNDSSPSVSKVTPIFTASK
ncbi:hypothetical protein GCM10007908_16010 [Rhizobium albus]|nr:hypothetical protein GCM10007908_16010 [Rhizobium albus]